MLNELVIVGLTETMAIRRESFGDDMSKRVANWRRLVTDLEFVVDLQVLVGFAFIHDVLQHCCPRCVRDIIVQRKGEGEVGLSVGSDVDILS